MNQLIIRCGYAVKPLESKETKAQREKTVTHNSVFAAHRLKNAVPRLRDGIFLFRCSGGRVGRKKLPRITRMKRIGERARHGRWFRRLAETILAGGVREVGTASPARETRALPNPKLKMEYWA